MAPATSGRRPGLASEYGMPALALTDHGNLFGAIAHYRACKESGVKPIIGCEVYVSIGSRHLRKPARGLTHASNHLVLLAKNRAGFSEPHQAHLQRLSRGLLLQPTHRPRAARGTLGGSHLPVRLPERGGRTPPAAGGTHGGADGGRGIQEHLRGRLFSRDPATRRRRRGTRSTTGS